MRVVHVVTAFPRREDDVITPWLTRLLLELRERGVRPEVLAPSYRGLGDHALHGIPVRRFRYAPARWETLTHDQTAPDRLRESPRHRLLVPGYLAAGCLAAARVGRQRPDIVHVHWPVPHALLGSVLRRASGGHTGLVCSFYSVELRWVERRLPWLRPLLRWSIRTAEEVTAISSATADLVRRHVDRPVRVIPFAAAVDPPPPSTGSVTALAAAASGMESSRLPFSEEEIQLLFVGRLVERKGVEVLVRALPCVLRRRPVRLTVVGEGSREAEIRRVAEDAGVASRITFAGTVGEAELARLYRACDALVLPAIVDAKGDTEGLGVVLLEALRFGRPVVASAVGGIPDIVEPGRTGWLVPPGDPEALATTLLALAERPEEARRVAETGRRAVAERFSWEGVIGELLACYRAARAARSGDDAT